MIANTTNATEDQEIPETLATGAKLDEQRYLKYVEHFDLDEAQQIELLQTLWWIMMTFVDLGFGVDSVQYCLPALAEIASESPRDDVKQIEHGDGLKGAGKVGRSPGWRG